MDGLARITRAGLCSVVLVSCVLAAAEEDNVAVLKLEARSISEEDASVLTDKLRGELVNTGAFQVIERGMMNQILQEQGFQQTGCTSDQCVVEIGQLIGVTRMVAGSVGKIEETYLVSTRLIDVATGKILKNVQKEITGSLTDVLKEGIPRCAAELAGVKPAAAAKEAEAKEPETTRSMPEEFAPEPEASRNGPVRFSVAAGYNFAMGWIWMNENYSIPTHGGMIAMGLAFRRSRLNCEFMVASGEPSYIDMAEVTNRTFDELTTTTVGGGLVWYLEVLRIADFITIAPAFGAGFWNTRDDYDGRMTMDAREFGTLLLRVKLGRGGWRLLLDAGQIVGTQPEIAAPFGAGYDEIYRIPPVLLIRAGLEATL